MNEKIKIMRDDDIPSALIKFGIPSIIGFLVTAVYNFVDAIFVGGLGTSAMGAAAVAFPISLIMIGIGLLFGSGAASLISRLLGEKAFKKASNIASVSICCSLIIGILVIVLFMLNLKPLLYFFGATDEIYPFAKDYVVIFIFSCLFSVLNIGLNHIARSEGAAKVSMNALLVGAVLNIILDPLLIYSFHLGIQGAAIATFASQVVSTLLLLRFFMSEKSTLSLSFKQLDFSMKNLVEILSIGFPYCIAQLLAGTSMGLINSAAAGYGEAAVAAVGIANRVFALGVYAMIGFSKGFQPIAGYNYGARNYDRLNQSVKTSIKWTTIFCIFLALIQIVFSKSIIAIFTEDALVTQIGIQTLIAYALIFPLFGYYIINTTLFLAVGRAREGFVLSIGRQGIFLIPIILILPSFLGLSGVILAQPIAEILSIIMTFIYSKRIKKLIPV